MRHRALWLFIGLLILTSLACNAFAGNLEPTLGPLPTAVVEETAPAQETADLAPTATLEGTTTAAVPGAQVIVLVDLNVRGGPGVQYDRVGFLLEGENARIIGRDPETGWWKVACPADVEEAECWVSGGAAYVRAEDAEDVPVAAVPPTPTPVPPNLGPNEGVLAYVDNGRLFAARLDLSQNPPTAAEARQLAEVGNVQRVTISPDGRRVAYLAGTSRANSLNLVNVDGRDRRTLVVSDELAVEVGEDQVALVDAVQWLDDGRLAFNTMLVNTTGPGVISREDFWAVTIDGEAEEVLAAGEGGGAFAIAGDTVLLSRSDAIARATFPDLAPETLISFGRINTASEYVFYPRPQWTVDGGAYVAIPDADPWLEGAGAALWQIAAGGPAVPFGNVTGNILFNPVVWSHRGGRLAYVQLLIDPTNPPPQLILADANGTEPTPYAEGDQLVFYAWSPDDSAFLYGGQGYYAIGRSDEAPRQMPLSAGQQLADAQWLTNEAFVIAQGFPESNAWNLNSVSVEGSMALLGSLSSGAGVEFDVWTP